MAHFTCISLCSPLSLAVGSQLPIEKIVRMVYLWSVKTPLGKMNEVRLYTK